MKSLQGRLIALLAIAMALLSVVAGGSLYAYLRHALLSEFDRSLAMRCSTLGSMVAVKPSGKYDIDIHSVVESESYRISDPAGKTVTQSATPLPVATPSALNVMNDVAGHNGLYRVTASQFQPPMEVEEDHFVHQKSLPFLTIVVARDRAPLDNHLLRVALSIAATFALLSTGSLLATVWIVRSGLQVLRRLAADASAIDVTRTDARFTTAGLPAELQPIARRLNDMLGRVGEAMTRERRFSADVAHELRTPIAELRSAAEVALRSPDDFRLGRIALTQAGEIAVQMQTVVSVLLSIVRKDAGIDRLKLVPVGIASLTDKVLLHFGVAADRVNRDIDPAATVTAEPSLLAAVLDNLIGNALHYGTDDETVSVRTEADAQHILLHVENAQTSLEPADIDHLFEPFWRKDVARSGGVHTGLGLTLARSYCRVMNAEIAAALPSPNLLRITIKLRRAAAGLAALEPLLTVSAHDA